MKLAEALLLRADMQNKVASLRERISQNAVVQDGEQPHEDPHTLLKEAIEVFGQLERLVYAINRANLTNKLPDGRSLTEAIARRDTLMQQHSLLQAAIEGTRQDPLRYSAREIKWVATVDVSQLQQQSEDIARKLRDVNARIQEANWKVELEE